MKKSTSIALVITLLDAMGIGLIMPVLPTLLREFITTENIANHFGVLLALYALMQVIFAPWLGKMSDRFGRRPILLLSLIGASLDYLLLAFSSALWMLYLGRLLSGITGATGAVAASVIADTTSVSERVKWFGRLGASFGVGLIAGPIIGGFAGSISAHSPFFIAAFLNIVTFFVVMSVFGETRKITESTDIDTAVKQKSNSVYITLIKSMPILLIIYFSAQLIGQIPATVWVLFTENRFAWNSMMVGFSLAGLGCLHALFQAFVAGRIASIWGEKTAIIVGFVADSSAFALLAIISEGWLVFPILILLAAGGIALPALQGLMSVQVNSQQQGALQGLLVSLTNATGVIGPVLFALIYNHTLAIWDGWVWIIGLICYLVVVLLSVIFMFNPQKLLSE
ncbi:Tet(A)/Tet(B)/Tet(C) family tetracycline efflux MFS transporter [Providencia manganoxydans]|uniref:Tetracycline resistance MFS efflux pump n=2 Tax=Providencia TaxID=586 RepID=A0A1S1HU66_PROST|nr:MULTISPECIES: Tet(A)/Tet(B)/Tet(C) family tetracycline efflux MFS transporter [Providencia]MDX4947882.1 Tet(A)/Tet(B)/Tet(C) family tetracycline efflux MFS transporter [Providencia manganoxydans]OHT24883.1 tetracycline resistance MFS efflux pump [Providencia stuartii]QQO63365.1 Tet(A)/Tet(B)/Tet(C) family tetracycline efflux MFS transporter [Providencia manganoxydans]HEF8771676.1 Tet(A)/Tet(B)/Tet(C) family tetracycline efflux MFS transporter [Providencia stuartii]HEF8774953.1 Tet(A)/Tet(B)